MSKMAWVMVVLAMLLTGCGRNVEEREMEMDVAQSRAEQMEYGTIEYLTIVTNTDEVPDWEACAEEIIERCVNNDFRTIRFSFDESGYPVELHAEVYLTQEDMKSGNAVFLMDYVQDKANGYQYNIKDDPEKFDLQLK